MKRKPQPKSKSAANESSFTSDDLAMFAKFKVPMTLVDEAGIRRVTDSQARELGIIGRSNRNMQGIAFPRTNRETGEIVNCRVRRDHPEMEDGKPKNKYMSPKGGPQTLFIHPRSLPKLKKLGVPIVLVESEKAVLALLALCERTGNELIPIALGGCWGWSQENKAISALLELCKGHSVYVLLDSNVASNDNVKKAQDALVAELSTPPYESPDVLVVSMPQIDGVNGPDDLIALKNGDNQLLDALEAAVPADPLGAYSDDALALEFTRLHGEVLRYVAIWGAWLVWEESRWVRDLTLTIYDKARRVCRAAADVCGKKQIAQRVRSAQTVAAVERLARADRQHAATADQWDANPWLLNTPDGVVDLHTGKKRPATREDYCTKMTTVSPGGECPLWRKVLREVTAGDRELQEYLQRVFGYILTGITREHAMFFGYGTGANGKSVVNNTMLGVMGDYGTIAPIETFTASQHEAHPTDLAGLQGARLVLAVETEEGRRWAESKLKAATGGDKMSARFMRQDFFTFDPQFKLVVSGNHRPGLRSVDESIRRRMNLIPFNVTIPPGKRDTKLAEKLRAEWGGILQWGIDGCLMWQRVGLAPPKAVTAATESYMASEDALGRWLDEKTVKAANATVGSTALFQAWRRWADAAGEYVGSQKRFSQNLEARGFTTSRTRTERIFVGLELVPVTDVTGQSIEPYREFSKTRFSTGISGAPVTPVTGKKFTRADLLTVIGGGRAR
jgi:P4 family phage/plasmid primase-like protien